jgi:predicted DsbA family dithiol-disulfide isomerase
LSEYLGKKIRKYNLFRPQGRELKKIQLNEWRCVRRNDLINYLYSLFPTNLIKVGHSFSKFIYENGKIVAALFSNGDVEYGDIFIAADGANSIAREEIFGKVNFTPVEVKEIVGTAYNEKIYNTHKDVFTKYQKEDKGIAFGLIPTNENEFVWFIQYDASLSEAANISSHELKIFCKELMYDFPLIVNEILDSTDFANSYIWNTRDFDLLPSFHFQNVVLIGDAAHVAVPFTSAGVTNAIIDAKTLADCIITSQDYVQAFCNYYEQRKEHVREHVEIGRKLKHLFLNPMETDEDDIPVPLIPEKKDYTDVNKNKPIQVKYFTDPICSTCWIIQPLLRKLKLEYDEFVNVEYRMGGLLKSWSDYRKKKDIIQTPIDAARHWEEVCVLHEMPLDGDVWIQDPPQSSYPPSIAFKAAQLQNNELAIHFLRRIKEMIFLEKKNIIRWYFLENAALEVGLDVARLKRDCEGKAKVKFKDDLLLAKELNVNYFPTLIFSDKNGNQITLQGCKEFSEVESIITKLLPEAQKALYDSSPEFLFNQFTTMTTKEYAFLTNTTIDQAEKSLNILHGNAEIEKFESKSGPIWLSNFGKRKR